SASNQPRLGLRERKKAKTRAALQEHALRLIREQGYAATTIEQIAEAAEVSPSTFFRYFPTKEDAVLYDPYDPVFAAAFRAQPPDVSSMQAMRAAMRAVFDVVPSEEMERVRELLPLILAVPEVRARMLDGLAQTAQLCAALVAEREGRPVDDIAVRAFAGAVIGAITAVVLAIADHPEADIAAQIDTALALLEAGLPL
ncbi:MAG TPA: TetR family transcriptional regulator, partial [Thermomicrobiales bacterium]|nr:TetR family transcriptional regulator [Thermomicrobiales bacterium]